MQVCWAVQGNMLAERDVQALEQACRAGGHRYEPIVIPPFTEQIPTITHDGPVVFYGSARLTVLIATHNPWTPGVFFDEAQFKPSVYAKFYGDHMLNADARQLALGDIDVQALAGQSEWFLRPDHDGKSFAGGVMTSDEILSWCAKLRATETVISLDAPVVLAKVKPIAREWRLFIVDGDVVTGSQYRRGEQRDLDALLASDLIAFARDRARTWSPSRAFVMDVARTADGEFKIVELNGINSCGFYAANIPLFVEALSNLARELFIQKV